MGTGFRNLLVWQKAKALAVAVYETTQTGPMAHDFGLRDQMRRAAVSVPSNIAEGDERDTDREAVRFLFIAKGSLAELRTQLEIARDIGSLKQESYARLEVECAEIARMLGALIKAKQAAMDERQPGHRR